MLERTTLPASYGMADSASQFGLFDSIQQFSADKLHFYSDPSCNLKAIIAVHNSKLGPALGGCRLVSYRSEQEAIKDALGLARGMSYKAAIHQLPFGGGKAVLIKPDKPIQDRQRYFQSFGRFLDSLNGCYVTAVDSGTSVTDMDAIASQTQFVTSTSSLRHGSGDPSPFTADGVLIAIIAAVQKIWGSSDLKGLRVAIQGVGHVGYLLAKALHSRGVELYVSNRGDAAAQRCQQEFSAKIIERERIHQVECDIFSPCALSGVLTAKVVKELNCRMVAGAANIQLAAPEVATAMHERGIVYLPDYMLNAGGLMHVGLKYLKTSDEVIQQHLQSIGTTVSTLLERSFSSHQQPAVIADAMVKETLYGSDLKETR